MDTLEAVEALESAILADPRDDDDARTVRRDLDPEIGIARTKLSLSLAWDSSKAAELIRGGQHEKHRQEDLTKWIRRRFRARDEAGYAASLVEELAAGGPKHREDVLARLGEMRELRLSAAAAYARGRLDDKDAGVRVAAARALLAIDPEDPAAASELLKAADAAPFVGDGGKYGLRTTPRVDALNECLDRGLLSEKDVRGRLAGAADPALVRVLLDALRRTKAPPTDDEARSAWRRLLDSPNADHLLDAVAALLDLRDRDARPLLLAALDRCAKRVGVRSDQRKLESIDELRARIVKEMPEPPTPK